MVKHTQTIRRQQSTDCLSVLDHFVGLALKGLFKKAVEIERMTVYLVERIVLDGQQKMASQLMN